MTKRILLTGMSGTGKTTLINELIIRGYKAIDLDCDEFSEWVEFSDDADIAGSPVEAHRDWIWRENRVSELLSIGDTEVLFVSGCAPNMGKFLQKFDHVVLLSAPAEQIVERLAQRTTNTYGKRPEELARILDLIDTVEPLLRKIADYEIDTSNSLDHVIEALLSHIEP